MMNDITTNNSTKPSDASDDLMTDKPMMNAWVLDALSGVDTLRRARIPVPVPGAGEVVLDLEFAALNPADRYLAEGQYPSRPALPHVLGRDGVGVVSAVGAGVTSVKVGEVYALLRGEAGVNKPGTFAQKVSVPFTSLVPVPAGWTHQQASCATLVYLTAFQALTEFGPLTPGAVVLVTGASGGVGVACVQLAGAMGLTVVGLSRSVEKSATLKQIGASFTFDPNDTQWRRSLKTALAGRMVDLAVDNIGGELLPDVIDTLGQDGRVSCVGRLAGPVPHFNTATLFFRRIQLRGVSVGAYTNAESHAAWKAVLKQLDVTGAKPLIDSVHAFDDVKQAFARLEAGPMGKVLLSIH